MQRLLIRNFALNCRRCYVSTSSALFSGPINYYDVLGVPKNASTTQIKTAFYAKSKILHPDTSDDKDASSEEFQRLLSAYHVLRTPHLKRLYDQELGMFDPRVSSGAGEDDNIPRVTQSTLFTSALTNFDSFYKQNYRRYLDTEVARRQEVKRETEMAEKIRMANAVRLFVASLMGTLVVTVYTAQFI